MAKLSILAGSTSQSVNVFIQDSSSTTGAGLTGLVYNTSSLTAYYTFAGANATAVAISLVTLASATTAYSSGGFVVIDGTNMPGIYRLDIPNAALATSKGRSVTIMLKGATNMAPCVLEIELVAVDNQVADSARTIGTVTTVTNQLTAAAIATGVWQDTTAGDFTTSLSIGKSVMNGVSLGTGLTITSVTGSVGSVTGAVGSVTGSVGSVTGAVGSVTGAVGSVTGAVGSVTGNVGGNVVGSVASVTAQVTANVAQINGSSTAATNLGATTTAVGRGTVAGSSSTTSVTTSVFAPGGAGIVTDQFKNRVIMFDGATATASLRGQGALISGNTSGATPTFTVSALTTAPASGDTFSVL